MQGLDDQGQALLGLLQRLDGAGYSSITPTPETHRRVLNRRADRRARDLRDVLGWSVAFEPGVIPGDILDLLDRGGALERLEDGRLKSAVRVSRLHGRLYLHSAFPTDDEDAVFLGPDSYRFADLIARELGDAPVESLAEIGAGAGVGAITAADLLRGARVTMTDVNPKALRLARINAAAAGVQARSIETSGLDGVEDRFDLIVANPPYIFDPDARTYRDGGALHGGAVSVEWTRAALPRLTGRGRFILYTGVAIVDGGDPVREALDRAAADAGVRMRYGELDPDIFGEQLSHPGYEDVERIAAVGAVFAR